MPARHEKLASQRPASAASAPGKDGDSQAPPHILAAVDLPPRIRSFCYLLPPMGYEVSTLFDEGQAVAEILTRGADHHLLLTNRKSLMTEDDSVVCALQVVERLRAFCYEAPIRLFSHPLSAEEARACQGRGIYCFPLPDIPSLLPLEGLEAAARPPRPAGGSFSILEVGD